MFGSEEMDGHNGVVISSVSIREHTGNPNQHAYKMYDLFIYRHKSPQMWSLLRRHLDFNSYSYKPEIQFSHFAYL